MQPEESAQQIVAAHRGGSDIREIMEKLAGLPAEESARVLTAIASDEGDDVVALLSSVAENADQRLAGPAVEALALHRTRAAANALLRLGDRAPDKLVRKEARRGLHRLRTAGIAPEEHATPTATPAAVRPALRYYRGMLTNPDPNGDRAVMVGAERPSGIVDGVFALLSEEEGLVRCYALESSRKGFDQQLEKVREQLSGLTWVAAPPAYCHFLIHQHAERTRAAGTLSPTREHCARVLGNPETLYQQPIIYERLSADEVRNDPSLLHRTAELFLEPEFGGWLLEFETVKKYAGVLREARESRLVLNEWVKKDRELRILDAAIEDLFTPAVRAAFAGRLEEMSFVLLESDRAEAARIALASALALREEPQEAQHAIPFVRALVLASIEYAIKTGFGRAGGIITP